MVNKKPIRTRGKLQLSRYFQELKKGDFVAISKEQSVASSFPKRTQGQTGIVEGRRGKAYIIKITEGSKDKRIIIEPIHLKKIKQVKR
jgi:large subunit ribosomal protein L21e